MSKEKIYAEIEQFMGQVPTFLKQVPEDTLASEWDLFKRAVFSENTAIPPKYRELIGIAVAAATHCWYCSNFHTGVAGVHQASAEEIQEATLLAKFAVGWSTFFHGTLYDKEVFIKELHEIGAYVSGK